jgi:hypothetical protein
VSTLRTLDPAKVVDTADALARRVEERFPASGLARVAAEVRAVSHEAAGVAEWLDRPNWWLRGGIAVFIALVVAVVAAMLATLDLGLGGMRGWELIQGIEAGVNDLVFLAIAIAFLVSWENRLRRNRALRELHVLRSLAHIIDMHQLTKDPERLLLPGPDTASSPRRTMTVFDLSRYLDYCSELLAVISKIAAIYVARFEDTATLAAVNEVEALTSGLARKIWQKLMILDRVVERSEERAAAAAAPRP